MNKEEESSIRTRDLRGMLFFIGWLEKDIRIKWYLCKDKKK